MRIAIDCREIKSNPTGIGRFLLTFLRYVKGDGIDYILIGDEGSYLDHPLLKHIEEKVIVPSVYPTIIWDQIQLPAALKGKKADLFFSPYYKFPVFSAVPSVITVFDLTYLLVEPYKNLLRHKWYVKNFIRYLHPRTEAVITSTNTSAEHLVKLIGIRPEKIEVVYLGIPDDDFRPVSCDKIKTVKNFYGINKSYLLYVGNSRPHKNLRRLIAAYKGLPTDIRKNFSLILVGAKGLETELYGDGIMLIDSAPDEILAALYSGAEFLIFPSVWEGFGYPLIEALSCGCPVICSDIPVFREILGYCNTSDTWVHYFNPFDVEDIREKILLSISNAGEIRKNQIERWHREGFRDKFSGVKMHDRIFEILRKKAKSNNE